MDETLQRLLKSMEQQSQCLYGTPQEPNIGLMWRIQTVERDISMVKKVAFALVPGTGLVWIAIETLLKLMRG